MIEEYCVLFQVLIFFFYCCYSSLLELNSYQLEMSRYQSLASFLERCLGICSLKLFTVLLVHMILLGQYLFSFFSINKVYKPFAITSFLPFPLKIRACCVKIHVLDLLEVCCVNWTRSKQVMFFTFIE